MSGIFKILKQQAEGSRNCARFFAARCLGMMQNGSSNGAPLAGGSLGGVLEVQQMALAVAILCHPGCDVRVRERVEGFL